MITFNEKVEMSLENWEDFLRSIKKFMASLGAQIHHVTLVLLLKNYSVTLFLQEEVLVP